MREEFTQNESSQDDPVSEMSQPSCVRVHEELPENVPQVSGENIQDSSDTMNDPPRSTPVKSPCYPTRQRRALRYLGDFVNK